MKIIYNRIFLEHDTGNHPENRKRLECFGDLPSVEIQNGEKYLNLVHEERYLKEIKSQSKSQIFLDPDTVSSLKSYEAACFAVGATIEASKNGNFALVRPPGHHAYPTYGAGFCIFNNMAIAVQKLVKEGKKIFIFDFDGHLGDGTENFFYKTGKVLYCSFHQKPAYPGSGDVSEIGSDEGKGYTINLPLSPGTADDIYTQGLDFILPVAKQFKPDVVGVSAGFDAYKDDPLLQLNLSLNMYYRIGNKLRDNFPDIFAVLEGGYNTDILPKAVYNFIDGINRTDQQFNDNSTTSSKISWENFNSQKNNLKDLLSPYWQF